MKRNFYIINAILIALILAGDVCYDIFSGLWLKSITSAGFVILGAINLVYLLKADKEHKTFGIIMFVGLVLGMIGDIVLYLPGEMMFILGAGIFAIGHVFYVVAYAILAKFKWTDLIFCVLIFVPSVLVITLVPIFDFGGIVMEIVCIIYALIISCMVGKALANLIRERNLLNALILIGSVLFFISDLMLLLDVFAVGIHPIVDTLCLYTYYPAQCLLAFSLLQTNREKAKDKE